MNCALTTLENKLARQVPITLRRCLGCDHWMRSTGADHRLCNFCKGQTGYYYHHGPGSRLA